jgi:Dyp-type peroxidase family
MAQQVEQAPKLRSSTDIQGNILAAFNKPFQAFLFLNFRNDGANARKWLGSLLRRRRPPLIATTLAVADHNDQVSASLRKGGPPPLPRDWMAVSLTSSGLVTLHPELAADLMQFQAFWEGPLGTRRDQYGNATTTAALLGDEGDSDPRHWVVGGPGQDPVDALVTLAADEEDQLDDVVNELVQPAGRYGWTKVGKLLVLLDQRGRALGKAGDRRELFGFKEGVSQPGVLDFSHQVWRNRRWEDAKHPGSPIIATGEFLLGYPGERRLDLRARPLSTPGWMRDGSFQVFRRLVQEVDRWDARMQRLGVQLEAFGSHPVGADELKAKVIGRHPNGCPLAPLAPGAGPNEFDYADDPEGVHTPLFAHIRRMNPRDDRVFYRAHRLLRRGIPFDDAVDDRGLLFNAFMASIEQQFEFLVRYWASGPPAAGQGADDGPDPLIGKRATADTRWVLRLPDDAYSLVTQPQFLEATGAVYTPPRPKVRQLDFDQFVRTTGGVYAFAPSIPTLHRLARAGSLVKAG